MLTLLVLACTLPTAAGFALLIEHFYDLERSRISGDTVLTARALMLAVDRDLNSGRIAARTLATSRDIALNDMAAFHAQARSVLHEDFPGFNFVLCNAAGQQIVNTSVPYGQPGRGRCKLEQVGRVFRTGQAVLSDVFVGDALQRPVVALHVPVWLDGKVAYSLAVGFLPERLSKILAEQRLPADRIVAIFDRQGVIVGRSHQPERIGQRGGAGLLAGMRAHDEGEVSATSLEGVPAYFMFSRSPVSGWTVAIGIPRRTVLAELLHSTMWISAAVLDLFLLGLGGAWYLGGRIGRSVNALAAPAPGPGAAPAAPMFFREAQAVAAELQRHRRHLEQLVEERTGQLEKSKALLEVVYATAPVGLSFVDADLCYVMVNEYHAAINGRSVREHLGHTLAEVVGASGLRFEQAHRQVLESGLPLLNMEVSAPLAGAPERLGHWIVNYYPVFGPERRIVGVNGVVVDISERKQTEEMLRAANTRLADSERLVRAIADNLPGMVAYWDAQLRCRFANKSYLEWFGRAPQEMIGMCLKDLLGERLFALNEPHLRRALDGEAQQFERVLTKPGGELGHTWASYIPDVDASGAVVGIFVMVTDITALKREEEARRIAAAAFESHEAMIITDAHCVILQVNRAFTETTGYAAEDVVGRTPRMFQSGRHDAAFYAAMWRSIEQTGSWKGEIWDRRKNGDIYPSWMTITAVKDAAGAVSHYVGAHIDISARKAAEEEIRQLAFFDTLTGLPNRRLLMERLRLALQASAASGQHGALLFVDLDNFKVINDSLGHDMGDLLLEQVARRLAACAGPGDTVARLGGDEFVVLLDNLSGDAGQAGLQVEQFGLQILAALRRPYELDGRVYPSTPSIGAALFSGDQHSIAELLRRADCAMYQAKAAGRNTLRFFDERA